ncbi:MAG TPA: imidazole glycerol phosphate synthase subunit HisH [Chthoniobacterales bacterium]
MEGKSATTIALLDYGSGNLRSVSKALEKIGCDVRLTANPAGLDAASAVVLPGVGAFGDCAANLRRRGLWQPVQDWLASGRPFLGICVGYQLLFEGSEETPGVEGLGFFKGIVKRFSTPGIKIPQIGWNTLSIRPGPLWVGLPEKPFVFFVHSYFPAPADRAIISAEATYGEDFAAAVSQGNVHAVQFHPEKSQANGLRILKNFIDTI